MVQLKHARSSQGAQINTRVARARGTSSNFIPHPVAVYVAECCKRTSECRTRSQHGHSVDVVLEYHSTPRVIRNVEEENDQDTAA